MLVTVVDSLAVAEWYAANTGLDNRVDIFEIEQFVALNLCELGNYNALGRKTAVTDLFERYNWIVENVETDPSLKITLR